MWKISKSVAWVLRLVLLRLVGPECCPALWGHTGIFIRLQYLALCATCNDLCMVKMCGFFPTFPLLSSYHCKRTICAKVLTSVDFSVPCSSSNQFNAAASIIPCSQGSADFLLPFLLENVLIRYLKCSNSSGGFI